MNERQSSTRVTQFAGSIPETYDSHLGPLLFQRYAVDLARRVPLARVQGTTVLEVAAGTGILTTQLQSRLGRGTQLTVTDISAPMLAVAKRQLHEHGSAGAITWSVADAMELPFADGEFDAVVCQFGVMFFPDKERAAREAYRVLRAGGQWLFSVWGSWDENVFGRIVHDTVATFFPDDPLTFRRGPFGFHDPVALRAVVTNGGFVEPEIVTLDMTLEAESAVHATIGLVRGGPLINTIERRGVAEPHAIIDAIADALARTFGDHPLRIPTRARVISAHRPC